MKKLLLASILMAFGASAHAVVAVGTIECIGQETSRTCTAPITCSTTCTTDTIALEIVDCIPLPLGNSTGVSNLIADREGTTADPICVWDVLDEGDQTTTRVTISSADGLPVELQSLSVE
jgi:hypothetical protein